MKTKMYLRLGLDNRVILVVKVRVKFRVRFQIRSYDSVAMPARDHSKELPPESDS
jgi:hypothetical protein